MAKKRKLLPPCGYMGGKRRVAGEVASRVITAGPPSFFDLCAGSGAITLGLVDAGYPASQITMVEAGPWGWFWSGVGDGSLDIASIERMLITELPSDPKKVASWLQDDVAKRGPTAATFLVLQAGSFGSVPVWWDGSRWRQANPEHNRGYNPRKYWQPGPSSKEKKPRGTIFNPSKIVDAVKRIASACAGVRAVCDKVESVDYSSAPSGTIFCIDPPYVGDSGYGVSLDVAAFVASGPRPLWVLEGRSMPGAQSQILGMRRGHNVNRGTARKPDYLNVFV